MPLPPAHPARWTGGGRVDAAAASAPARCPDGEAVAVDAAAASAPRRCPDGEAVAVVYAAASAHRLMPD
ncbi:hypothetical protein C1N59_22255 (plasmid) [Pantoea sp. SGAir0183]